MLVKCICVTSAAHIAPHFMIPLTTQSVKKSYRREEIRSEMFSMVILFLV